MRDMAGELPRGLDSTQLRTLKLVSLCLASLSVVSAILAFYWFIRIRRSFRHE
jgi:G protein-coupled receptor GPR1